LKRIEDKFSGKISEEQKIIMDKEYQSYKEEKIKKSDFMTKRALENIDETISKIDKARENLRKNV
jgi:hypothetical protein